MACDNSSTYDGPVAFTAKLIVGDSYPSRSGIINFATVLVNEGGGYSPGTGIFTCPRDGLYYFTVHASVSGVGQCAIFKNGENLVSLYHSNKKESQVATVSAVVKLSTRDEVWVNAWGPDRNGIFATKDNDTVFVGFCLSG